MNDMVTPSIANTVHIQESCRVLWSNVVADCAIAAFGDKIGWTAELSWLRFGLPLLMPATDMLGKSAAALVTPMKKPCKPEFLDWSPVKVTNQQKEQKNKVVISISKPATSKKKQTLMQLASASLKVVQPTVSKNSPFKLPARLSLRERVHGWW